MRSAISILVVLCALATQARAIPYETFIDVDDEGDLQDLLASQSITDDTFNELLDLLDRGVDLSTADRNELYALPNLTYDDVDAIIAYRSLQKGRISDPSELVTSGALTQDKLLSISAFLIVKKQGENPLAAHAWVRAATRVTQRDMVAHDIPYQPESRFYPPLALRARVTAARYLTAGVALTTTRLEIGNPVYDPQRNALVADPASYQVHIPKAYVRWDTNTYNLMLGSFRAGFGQRLVFDNSIHYSPNGLYLDDQVFFSPDLSSACKESGGELVSSPCTGPAGDEYVTPDFVWRDGLFGAAAGFKHLELSTGWLQGYAFASASRRSLYQYELWHVDPDACPDPRDDTNPACTAPPVYVRQGDLLRSSPSYSFVTLPNVFQERLVGGNFAYFADRRNSIGVTAFGANEANLIDGIDLSTQEWSRYPGGNKFGAAGVNFSFGRGIFDLFGELASSFDNMKVTDATATPSKGGGGPAAVLRFTVTPTKREELEVTGRYFSTDYANPYARPISQPDEFEGDRARDEAGGRIRYVKQTKEMVIRALADVWVNPSRGETTDKMGNLITSGPKVDTYVRANVKTTPTVWLGLWERYQDKDLSRGGHDQCFEVSNVTDVSGEPIPCAGRQLTTILRGTYEPNRMYSGQLLLEHQLLDDNTQTELKTKFRQDIAAWFIGYYRASDDLHIRLRLRYLNESINDPGYLETSFAGKVDVLTRVRDRDTLRVRLEGKWWLDSRDSTLARRPNPEATLWLFYDARL